MKKPSFNSRSTIARLGWLASKFRKDGEVDGTHKVALEWECSYKTINRDIDALRDFFGFPITYDPNQYKWRITGQIPEARIL